MLLLWAVAATLPLQFHYDATEFANAAYHAACLSGHIYCSREVYERFWAQKYQKTAEDQARFDEFGSIFAKLEAEQGPPPSTPFLPNDLSYMPGAKVRERLLSTLFASRSPADFRRRSVSLMHPTDAQRLAEILDALQRRLHPWWLASGQPIVKQCIAEVRSRVQDLRARQLASEVAGFLDSRPSSTNYYLHLIPSPDFDGEEADGTEAGDQFVVEVNHRVNTSDIAWVAVHEFTHSLYAQAPQERKAALMRQFIESGDPSAHAFYLYLNEAMATAVELLLVERMGKTLDEPYTDPYIPRLGKAVLPLLRSALANRQHLYDGFTAPYLAAARVALGPESDGLPFRFSCGALIGDEDIRSAFLARLPLRYNVPQEAWHTFSRIDGLLMLRYDQIHFDGDGTEEIVKLQQQHRGFVYISRKDEHLEAFMLGRDTAAVKELGKMWAESKEHVREGLIFTLD